MGSRWTAIACYLHLNPYKWPVRAPEDDAHVAVHRRQSQAIFLIGMLVSLPMTALAYGVVLGPLLFMAQSDPGVDSSPLRALAFAVLAFATIVVGYLLDVTIVTVIGGLIVLTVLTAVLTTTLAGRAALRRSGVDPTARDALGVGRTLHQAITRAS